VVAVLPAGSSRLASPWRRFSYSFLTLNVGVPFVHTAVTWVRCASSSSPLRKLTSICPEVEVSTCTRHSFSGWAFWSRIAVPVQRTVTSPPVTLTVL
jgi:hypothetical protein